MITAVETITLFNQRYDWDERRDVFIPTVIEGVAFHQVLGETSRGTSGMSGSFSDETLGVTVRIPLDATVQADRQYVDDITYKELDDEAVDGYWTLSDGSYLIAGGEMPEEGTKSEELTLQEIQKTYGGRLIGVVEFADNTRRGSRSVRHWRIGGA